VTPPPAPDPRSELRRRRDRLAEEVAELQWALGGLAYEMAIRDHFRRDLLLRRAAMLQERDAELAEVERLLHMQESSVAGNCAACGAVRSRGAVYCWQCGAAMMERVPVAADEVTVELNELAGQAKRVPSSGGRVPATDERVPSSGERVPPSNQRVPAPPVPAPTIPAPAAPRKHETDETLQARL
jgi:hypothetical protein